MKLAAERRDDVSVAMQQRAPLVALGDLRHREHGLAAAEPQICNGKLRGHPGREAHRVSKPVSRSVVDLQPRPTRRGAELRRVHADEDPPSALAVAVDDGLLAVPILEQAPRTSPQEKFDHIV